MTSYLVDTNVVMKFCNPADVQHQLATDATSGLLMQSEKRYTYLLRRVYLTRCSQLIISRKPHVIQTFQRESGLFFIYFKTAIRFSQEHLSSNDLMILQPLLPQPTLTTCLTTWTKISQIIWSLDPAILNAVRICICFENL